MFEWILSADMDTYNYMHAGNIWAYKAYMTKQLHYCLEICACILDPVVTTHVWSACSGRHFLKAANTLKQLPYIIASEECFLTLKLRFNTRTYFAVVSSHVETQCLVV